MNDKKYINPFTGLVEEICIKFDKAYEAQNIEELENLINIALASIESLNLVSQAKIYYSLGTTLSDLEAMSKKYQNENNVEMQIFYFRKSINIISNTDEVYKPEYLPYIVSFELELYTNYANCLSRIGRTISSLEYYNKILNISSNFAMAIGNLGIAYFHYAGLLYDTGHKNYMYYFAYQYLKKALSLKNDIAVEKKLEKYISQYNDKYVKVFLEKKLDIPQYTYENQEELSYRKWVLNERLFLNPLNDLPVSEFCFATDVIHLPSMIVDINETPKLHGLYNQLKQEYVFARYQYYESIQLAESPHFADRDNYLVQFPDYPQYSIRIEKVKNSFRVLYSVLDKVAFFLNEYFNLEIREKDVSFRSVWRDAKRTRNGEIIYKYRNKLNPSSNQALNAIYWISKDVYEKNSKSPNPSAKDLSDIRNSLEHKYVKIYSDNFPIRNDGEIDELAYYLSENQLMKITLNLMKMIREILINLSFSVHIEEVRKRNNMPHDAFIPEITFIDYMDEWKI